MYIYIYTLVYWTSSPKLNSNQIPIEIHPKTNIIHSKEFFIPCFGMYVFWDVSGSIIIQNPIHHPHPHPSHPSPEARDVSAPPGRSAFGRVAAGGPRTAQRPGSGTGGQLHGAAPGGWG